MSVPLQALSHRKRWINSALWTAQVIIFLSFVTGAYMKIVMPIPKLAAIWPWAGALPEAAVRGLGVIDLAGGIGVLLPSLTRIMPGLTVLAAIGCVLLQICAMVFHLSRGEADVLPVNVFLLALSAFIGWGRTIYRIQPR